MATPIGTAQSIPQPPYAIWDEKHKCWVPLPIEGPPTDDVAKLAMRERERTAVTAALTGHIEVEKLTPAEIVNKRFMKSYGPGQSPGRL
jgi:hypothetical protein